MYMTDEQRAHEFALEIMKMYFQANDLPNLKAGVEHPVSPEEYFKIYEGAFQNAMEHFSSK